jgi:hypothetical protein
MAKGVLSDREKALEESYFRQHDAKLLEKLRQRAGLDDIATALAEKLQVENPALLARARKVGVTADTAAAVLLAPLVQIAWAEGSVGKRERAAVLRLASERGVPVGTPAHAQLVRWLEEKPDDALFDTALECLESALAVRPPKERDERLEQIADACREVAEASGTEVARLIGLGNGVSSSEASILDTISKRLRGRR